MKTTHLPQIDSRYWSAILLASIFGTNLGDLYAHESGLGLLGGLPILAAIVAIIYVAERFDGLRHEVWYWLTIIVIRTGATNIADYVCGRRGLAVNRWAFSAGLAVLIALLMWKRLALKQSAKDGLPQTDWRYWLSMLAAGVFGTAAGDAVLKIFGGPVGSGGVIASLVLSVIFGVLLFSRRGNAGLTVATYWLTVCIARTAGTALGDTIAENHSLAIGLPVSTLATGTLFVVLLLVWRSEKTTANGVPVRDSAGA